MLSLPGLPKLMGWYAVPTGWIRSSSAGFGGADDASGLGAGGTAEVLTSLEADAAGGLGAAGVRAGVDAAGAESKAGALTRGALGSLGAGAVPDRICCSSSRLDE